MRCGRRLPSGVKMQPSSAQSDGSSQARLNVDLDSAVYSHSEMGMCFTSLQSPVYSPAKLLLFSAKMCIGRSFGMFCY